MDLHFFELKLKFKKFQGLFKFVYVAPMKALAAEMTAGFGKRLEPLGISVRELTGDMSLTKAEIANTQVLVTTPEKVSSTLSTVKLQQFSIFSPVGRRHQETRRCRPRNLRPASHHRRGELRC